MNERFVSDDRRSGQPGVFFTRAQFAAWALVIFSSVTTAQLGINYYAFRSWVHEETITEVARHNGDPTAHASELLKSQQQRAEIMLAITALQTKLDGIERMLTIIAQQGQFNTNPNGNGKR